MAAMHKFRVVAYSFEGARQAMTVSAPSAEDAQRKLWDDGFRIVEMKSGRLKMPTLHEVFPSFFKVRKSEIVLLTRQLATFVKVGVPLLEALAVIHEQTSSKELRIALQQMMVDLGQGRRLSDAMKSHPRIFSNLYVDMVRAAEVSGELDIVLYQIADYQARDDDALRRIRSAMIYPAIVISLAFGVITVLLVFVLPAFVHLFNEFNADLPLPTKILLGIGGFMGTYRVQLGLGFLLVVSGLVLFLRSQTGKYFWDRNIVRLPYLGRIIHYAIIERFLRTFATMTKAGIPVTQMFDAVIEATGNLVFESRLRNVKEMMIAGEGFAGPLRQTELFPPLVIQMIRVGEETGTLDANLEQAAQFYNHEIEFRTKSMVAVLEPGLVIFIGLIVAFVAISVISPMYGLVRAIK
ncbi:MAG TPA: type II secretion system F family protein [Candidatus Dormibacteraeota bacterium]|jgi:type IV pilus assembly protein PilC|nr:type II secretion system F family protein [Candidatus Dormibacteraeota bacterium]